MRWFEKEAVSTALKFYKTVDVRQCCSLFRRKKNWFQTSLAVRWFEKEAVSIALKFYKTVAVRLYLFLRETDYNLHSLYGVSKRSGFSRSKTLWTSRCTIVPVSPKGWFQSSPDVQWFEKKRFRPLSNSIYWSLCASTFLSKRIMSNFIRCAMFRISLKKRFWVLSNFMK